MSKNKTLGVKLFIPAFLLSIGLLGAFLFPTHSSDATSSSSAGTELGATVIEYIRLALDTDSVALSDGTGTVLTPSASGTLATGDLKVAVTTNSTKGFSIAVYTQDETTAMTSSGSSSATIPSIADATGYDASTGASSLNTDTWGFRKKTGESTYGNWFGVGADDAHSTVVENSNTTTSSYCATLAYPLENSGCANGSYAEHTLNFGANLTSNLPAGTYTNNIIVSAVAKSEGQTYTINFDSNGGQNTMGTKTIVAGSTFTMPSTSVTSQYPFLGYAFAANAKTATYEPGDVVTVNDFLTAATAAGQDIDNALTLYLIWDLPLQAMQAFDCTTLNSNQITTLVDSRDNHEYKVKKLPDGKCWMINNLTLTATDLVTNGKALTNADTNIPASDNNSYYIPPQNARYSSSDNLNTQAVASASASVNFSRSNSNYLQVGYRAAGDTNNKDGTAQPEATAFYNFYTATLGFSYYNDGKTSGSSTRDICPKGWRLPKVTDGGEYSITAASSEFANLARSYNSSASWTNANTSRDYYTSDSAIHQNMFYGDSDSLDPTLNTNGAAGFTYAGDYNGTMLGSGVGEGGLYWSSSVYNANYSYGLYASTAYVYPQYYDYKYSGYAVRCVAQ